MADEEEVETPFETKTVTVEYTVWGEYHYFASFCYSFGYRATRTMGETLDLRRIWFDGELVYDANNAKVKAKTNWYFRHGTSDQVAVPGAELAYREHIYLWFANVDLGTDGRLPAVSIEIWEDGNLSVKDAIELLGVRAGFAAEDVIVSDGLAEVTLLGYILDGTATLESVLTDLGFFYDFAYTEVAGQLIVSYDYDEGEFQVEVQIPASGLAVLSENSREQKIDVIEVGADQGLPRSITASYFAADDDYQTGHQTAFRNNAATASQNDVSLSLPIVAFGTEVRGRLFDALGRVWHEKNSHSLRLMPAYARVNPGTTIGWESYGNQYTGVVTKIVLNGDWSSSVVVLERDAEYVGTVVDTQGPATPVDAVTGNAVRVVIMDVPDWDEDQTEDDYLNYRVAIGSAGLAEDWLGAQLDIAKASDLGNFQTALILGPTEQIGIADLVSIGAELRLDPRNFDLTRFETPGLLIVGRAGSWEFIEYTTVAMDDATVVLTGLTRGLFGTDDFSSKRAAGDTVVFAEDTVTLRYTVEQFRDYIEFSYRAVAAFQNFDDVEVSLYRPQGNSRKPYSPNGAGARREVNGDITITWERHDRFDGEPDDVYSVDIFAEDWSRLIRRITNIDGPQVTYNVAAQTIDGTETMFAEALPCTIFQINASHVGRGFAGGGYLVLGDAGILEGRVGPVLGPYGNLRVWSAWRARIGPVRGPRSIVYWGSALVALDGRVGPVIGPRGTLRGAEFYGRVGPVVGPSGDLFVPEYPILRYRSSGWIIGTDPTPGDMMVDDTGLAPSITYGDVLIVHDVRYGTPSHVMTTRDAGDERFVLLGTLDKRSTSGLWEAVYSFVVDNPSDLPVISAGHTTFVNPLGWCMTQVTVWSNVDNDDPVDAFGMNFSNSNTTSHVAPSVTTTEANDALLTMVGTRMNSSTATYTGPSGQTDLGGANSVNDSAYPGEYAGGDLGHLIDAAHSIKATAGATGTKSFGYSGSFPYVSASVALKYAPAPESPALPLEYEFGAVETLDANAITLDIPPGLVGDLLYVYLFRTLNAGTATTPSGWTAKSNLAMTVCRQQVFSKVADGSEGSTVTINYNISGDTEGFVVRVRYHGGEDADTEYAGDNNNTNVDLPTITPAIDGELIIAFAGWVTGSLAAGPAGFTVEIDDGGSPETAAAVLQQDDATPTGVVQFFNNSAQRRAGYMVAIKPSFEAPGAYLFGSVGPVEGPGGQITVTNRATAVAAMSGFGCTAAATVTSPPAGHAWWRVYITANNGDGNFTVANGVEFRDSGNNIISRVGATYFADSDDGLSPAVRAWGAYVSGSYYWQSNSAGTFPRIFGIHYSGDVSPATWTLSYIRDPNRMPKTFKVQYSDDSTTGLDGTWTDCAEGFYADQTGWNSTLPPIDIRTFNVSGY
jgi:plastocyanin